MPVKLIEKKKFEKHIFKEKRNKYSKLSVIWTLIEGFV